MRPSFIKKDNRCWTESAGKILDKLLGVQFPESKNINRNDIVVEEHSPSKHETIHSIFTENNLLNHTNPHGLTSFW